MECGVAIDVQVVEAVLLYKIRLNRGDSGRVLKDFYFLDPDIAQGALDKEIPENRFSKVVPVHGLFDKNTKTYFVSNTGS